MNRFVAITFLTVTLFSSCHYITSKKIKGDGNVITQTRTFTGFTGVDVSSAIHLYIKQDSAFSVKVETDDNLQQYIEIELDGGSLRISQRNNTRLDATGRIKVYVSAPSFKYLEASGACKIVGENLLTSTDEIKVHITGASDAELEFRTPKVSAELTGASDLRLKGQTRDLYIEGTGASHAKCFELLSENADVDVAGASSVDIFSSIKINAEASGASNIRYKGNATVASQNVSGAASIKKVE